MPLTRSSECNDLTAAAKVKAFSDQSNLTFLKSKLKSKSKGQTVKQNNQEQNEKARIHCRLNFCNKTTVLEYLDGNINNRQPSNRYLLGYTERMQHVYCSGCCRKINIKAPILSSTDIANLRLKGSTIVCEIDNVISCDSDSESNSGSDYNTDSDYDTNSENDSEFDFDPDMDSDSENVKLKLEIHNKILQLEQSESLRQ